MPTHAREKTTNDEIENMIFIDLKYTTRGNTK